MGHQNTQILSQPWPCIVHDHAKPSRHFQILKTFYNSVDYLLYSSTDCSLSKGGPKQQGQLPIKECLTQLCPFFFYYFFF